MKIHRLSPLAIAVVLAACGGSSSNSSSPTVSSGLAVDGYISGATVTCDANSNGVADTGETSTTTSSTGAYSLECASPLVLTGGTNIDTNLPFEGRLRAPVGSTVITPLTNLVALGMSKARVAEVLGLPAGTDVTAVDPAAKTNGLLVNEALFQRTLALQQVIQQTAEVIFSASLSGTPSSAVGQAQYAEIAKAVAAQLNASGTTTPLISSAGTVSSSLVTTLVSASVTAIQASTDTTLSALKTAATSLNATKLAEFLQPSLTDTVGDFAVGTQTGLEALAKRAGADTVLTEVTTSLRTGGAFNTGSTVDLSAVATATQEAVAGGVITSSTITALSSAGVTTPPAATVVTDYFAIAGNSIILGVATPSTYILSQLESTEGITLTGPSSSTDDLFNLSFNLTSVGTPITSVTAGLGFELVGTGTDQRVFRFIINTVNLERASNGTVSATVPASATLSVYARKQDGSQVTFTQTNLGADTLSTSAGSVTFNASNVVTQILAQANSTQSSFFTNFLNSTGTFSLKAVLSNTVPIRASDASLLDIGTITVGTSATVSGPSVAGKVTIN